MSKKFCSAWLLWSCYPAELVERGVWAGSSTGVSLAAMGSEAVLLLPQPLRMTTADSFKDEVPAEDLKRF